MSNNREACSRQKGQLPAKWCRVGLYRLGKGRGMTMNKTAALNKRKRKAMKRIKQIYKISKKGKKKKKKSCHLIPKVVTDLPFEGRKVEGSQKYRRRERVPNAGSRREETITEPRSMQSIWYRSSQPIFFVATKTSLIPSSSLLCLAKPYLHHSQIKFGDLQRLSKGRLSLLKTLSSSKLVLLTAALKHHGI